MILLRSDAWERVSFFADGWDDDKYSTIKTDQLAIAQIDYQKLPKLDFEFDFGDGHCFEVVFKGKRKKNKKDREIEFPKLIDQRGVAPEQYPDCDFEDEEDE